MGVAVQRQFEALGEEHYDVLVVGGGIHGVWTARAAAMRGLKVALAESVDYASGTSSRSTMLAHGGLRYLAQFDVGLVKEALQERGILTAKAPHLVRPLPFILPFYEGMPYPRWQLTIGIMWYSWLARGSGYPRHRFLSKEQVLDLEPGLSPKGLMGGALYYDGQILAPERLCATVALDADRRGAVMANHAEITKVTTADRVTGAVARDRLTGDEVEISARTVLNTTGPFLDGFLEQVGAQDDVLRLTKGVHLITPPFTEHAIVINAPDGRTFFSIPWYEHQLIGTTDTDYTDDPREVHATSEDVAYLQDATLRYFPDAPVDQVLYTNAGLRNLLNIEGVHPSQVTRRPLIHDHEDEGMAGLVSLAGGKLTTARATASEILDAARPHLARPAERVPDLDPLPGGGLDLEPELENARHACHQAGLDPGIGDRLVALYGARWVEVADAGLSPLSGHQAVLEGEVLTAARHESAWTVEDVLRRRTLAWVSTPDQGLEVAEEVAVLLEEGGIPGDIAQGSVEGYRETVALHERWRQG